MRICFIDMSTKLKTINDLQTQARGGMVSSLFAVSDRLAQMGHETAVISDISEGGRTVAGTEWLTDYDNRQFDVLVCNRGVGDGFPSIRAKKRVLWTHDLPHNGFIENPPIMRAFSGVVYMSQYAKRVWHTFYPVLDKVKAVHISNGVDKGLFSPAEKDYDRLIYISAPNRGLERLPLIYEAVQTRLNRPIRFTAYSNLAKLHPNEGEDNNLSKYKSCAEAGIEMLDPIPQTEIAKELGNAGAMVLPTSYPEICSNSVLQSLTCGTPIFTTGNLGSACEWIRHNRNGMLTTYQPQDYMVYQVEMVRNLVNVMENAKRHQKMCRSAANTPNILTWDEVAYKWHKMLRKL